MLLAQFNLDHFIKRDDVYDVRVPSSLTDQSANDAVYYTLPNRLDLRRTITAIVAGAIVAAGGAVLYVKVLPNLEGIHFLCITVCAAAVGTGVIGLCVVSFGKVRVRRIAMVIGLLLGFVVLAVMWLVWLHDTLHRMGISATYWGILCHPQIDCELIRFINQEGTWTVGADRVYGFTLALAWIGEAALILTGGLFIPMGAVVDDEVICLFCNSKCRSIGRLPRFDAAQQAQLVAAVEARDFASLTDFAAPEHEDAPEVTMRLLACPKCGKTNVLTVSRIAWMSKDGRYAVITTPLIKQLLIAQAEVETIKEAAETMERQRDAESRDEQTTSGETGSSD